MGGYFVPNIGDRETVCFRNATTSAYNIIFAAGNGIDLEHATSTLNIYPTDTGCITFIKQANHPNGASGDVTAIFGTWVNAD